ncbi:MAG: hypothetical protein ACRELT_02915 [Longimicrobiales bacterium]
MKNQTRTNAEHQRRATGKVREKVGDAKESVQETAAQVAAEARDKGEHLMEEGRDRVHELGDRASEIARSRADREKDRLTTGIRTFADVLRRGSEGLAGERDLYRPVLTSAADRVENISSYLESRDIDALTNEVRRFAREHTPLFLGGAFALGFAGARFIKSSGDHAARERAAREYGEPEREERFDRMLSESDSQSRTASTGLQGDGSAQGGSYE